MPIDIFATVGSQKFQFNRLIQSLDLLMGQRKNLDEDFEVFAQIGYTEYEPKNFPYKRFLNQEKYNEAISQANIIVTHGGTATIISAIKMGKKVIAVPRLAKYGEHVDDHQLQIIHEFEKLNLIYACYDCEDLDNAINYVQNTNFTLYKSNTSQIIQSLDEYIKSL